MIETAAYVGLGVYLVGALAFPIVAALRNRSASFHRRNSFNSADAVVHGIVWPFILIGAALDRLAGKDSD